MYTNVCIEFQIISVTNYEYNVTYFKLVGGIQIAILCGCCNPTYLALESMFLTDITAKVFVLFGNMLHSSIQMCLLFYLFCK